MGEPNPRAKEPRKDPLHGTHPKYERIRDLSTGAFGEVQLCRNKKNGQLVAIKFLERVRLASLRCWLHDQLPHKVSSCMVIEHPSTRLNDECYDVKWF